MLTSQWQGIAALFDRHGSMGIQCCYIHSGVTVLVIFFLRAIERITHSQRSRSTVNSICRSFRYRARIESVGNLSVCEKNQPRITYLHKLKVAFNNDFRMMHNLPTYCSVSEMFTVNRAADCKAVIGNLVHRFMMRLTISKHLHVRSIVSSDLVCSSRIRRHWAILL